MDAVIRRDLLRKLDHADAFPLVALQASREVREILGSLECEAIVRARDLGASLDDIAEALAITRQGASYRLRQAERNLEQASQPSLATDADPPLVVGSSVATGTSSDSPSSLVSVTVPMSVATPRGRRDKAREETGRTTGSASASGSPVRRYRRPPQST